MICNFAVILIFMLPSDHVVEKKLVSHRSAEVSVSHNMFAQVTSLSFANFAIRSLKSLVHGVPDPG